MKKGKVLVVDDEKDILALLQDILTTEGYEIATASNGKDALKYLEKAEPDLIILDLVMPKGGGVSFYHSIARKTDGTPRYPVLILTGHSEYESVFLDFHTDGFMTKPFQTPHLLKEIEKIFQKKKMKTPHLSDPLSGASEPKEHAGHASEAEQSASKTENAPQKKELPPHFQKTVLIKDIMTTHVLTAHTASSTLGMNEKPSDKLSYVVDLLRRHKIRHLPVVDGHQKLVGLISEGNLLRHTTPKRTEEGYEFDMEEVDQLILEHVMTREPVCVHPEDPISRACSIMATEKYGAIPVVDHENKLVGIVSQVDFLKLLTRWLEAA